MELIAFVQCAGVLGFFFKFSLMLIHFCGEISVLKKFMTRHWDVSL